MIDAYLADADGVVAPNSSLVTGYDFLADAADAVKTELQAGTGGAPCRPLITPANPLPQDPASWTADQLRAQLLGSRRTTSSTSPATSARTARSRPTSRRACSRPSSSTRRRTSRTPRLQRRLPLGLQPRRRRRRPGRHPDARLGAGVRPQEGDARRRHRLPVRRHRLPRVQRADLPELRAGAALRAPARSASARRSCGRSSATSRRRPTSAGSTRRRCSRRRSSACRCSRLNMPGARIVPPAGTLDRRLALSASARSGRRARAHVGGRLGPRLPRSANTVS